MNTFNPNSVTITQALPSQSQLRQMAPNIIIITDENLARHYGEFLEPFPLIITPAGESSKSLQYLEKLCAQLLEIGADRDSFLVGFGGGMITDLTGFAASIYMRGVKFGFISTSLLGQLDASVGGKNGVNLLDYKNILGCFNHPQWVVCPTNCLATLPERELISGYSEAIKSALLRDSEMLGLFDNPQQNITEIVRRTVLVKSNIVTNDPTEKGERALLNLGHTFAHAIEKCEPSKYLHGEAVAIGLVMMAKLSHIHAGLSKNNTDIIISLIEKLGLPTTTNIPFDQLAEAMLADKKKHGEMIDFILLSDFQSPLITPITAQKTVLANFLLSLHN